MGRPALPVIPRLLANREIDPAKGCWLWTGGERSKGYGGISIKGKNTGVHVAAAIAFKGFIPREGICVLHRCDIRLCFNPDHLFEGTKGDNNRDAYAKKRQPKSVQTICKRGHPLSGGNLSTCKTIGRRCLACHRIDQQMRDEAAKQGKKFSWRVKI